MGDISGDENQAMNENDTLHEQPCNEPDQFAIEKEICYLIDEACLRLSNPESAVYRNMLDAFRKQVAAGNTEGFDGLLTLIDSCKVYQTIEDGLYWSADQLAVQLDNPHDASFNVSLWATRLDQLIRRHRELK